MPKNCLEGPLTNCCEKCEWWSDGKHPEKGGLFGGIGCAAPFPINWCESFNKMYEEEQNENVNNDSGLSP